MKTIIVSYYKILSLLYINKFLEKSTENIEKLTKKHYNKWDNNKV